MTVPGASARPSFCTSCGAPASGARFCTSCGAPLAAPAPAPDDTATQVIARPAASPDAPDQAATQVVPQLAPEPEHTAPDAEQYPATWFDESAEDPYAEGPYAEDPYAEGPYVEEAPVGAVPRRRRRGRVLAAAFAALLLLGVAGFFGYGYVRDGDVRTALAAST